MPKWGAVVVSIVTAFLVVQPAFRDPPRDSFPLSNYPMFAQELGTVNSANTVVGLTAAGDERQLSPRLIASTDEVIQAEGFVYSQLASGTAAGLCRDVAERVASRGPGDVVTVEVVTQRQDSVGYWRGERDAEVTVHARCEVVR
jgi:hypothetical protein